MHDEVSSNEAALRAGMPKRLEISRVNEPTVIMATVLLAVHMFTNPTSTDTHTSAPRIPFI